MKHKQPRPGFEPESAISFLTMIIFMLSAVYGNQCKQKKERRKRRQGKKEVM